MSNVLIQILNMSLSASCVALIVMVIRLPLRKVPKVYSYALWAVVFFRLLCPLTVTLPMSAVPVQPETIPQSIVYDEHPAIASGVPVVDDTVNRLMATSLPETTANNAHPLETALSAAAYLWFGGALALIFYGVVGYARLKTRVSTSVRVHDHIYETDRIKTPFVLGFFHPRIYVPTGLEPKELEYVAAHEQTHIRRFDHLLKPLAFLITALHWFNPLVWLSYALMIRDMELSADESVMKRYDFDIRTAYASSLLSLAVKKSGFFTPLAFGETGVKTRVKNVLRYKKPALWISIGAILTVAAATLFLVTDNEAKQGANSVAATAYSTSYDHVSVSYLSDFLGFKTTDYFETTAPEAVGYIDTAVRTSTPSKENPDLNDNSFSPFAITLSGKSGETQCKLYYDSLYHKAYIQKDNSLFATDEDFARYVDALFENTGMDFRIDKDAVALFKKYGWTLDYRISTKKLKLGDIRTISGFDPSTYYFAYHNALSKDIGLDMSSYINKNVDVMIYRVRESMPEEFKPLQTCRGVIIKYNGKTIGAFISAGRHDTFISCSLQGKSFQEATGETVHHWLSKNVKADAAEKKMALLQPQEVIATYIEALNNHDLAAATNCLSKETMLQNLSINLPNQDLYQEQPCLSLTDFIANETAPITNLKSAKLIDVTYAGYDDSYAVTVDLEYQQTFLMQNGTQSWNCTMIYESSKTGWKIVEFGQG